jgi:hypothetical protein
MEELDLGGPKTYGSRYGFNWGRAAEPDQERQKIANKTIMKKCEELDVLSGKMLEASEICF